MSRDKVDGLVILVAVLCVVVVAYVAYQQAQTTIVHDCLQLEKFQVDGRVFSCYTQQEESGEDA
jgi:hypothetical protein